MIVVSNTSPLSNLLIAGQLELLSLIYQQVTIPSAVDRELRYLQNLGILSAAKRLGLIPAVKPILEDMIQQANFRVERALYEQTLRDAGE